MNSQEPHFVKILTVFLLIWIALMIYIDRSVLVDFANNSMSKVVGISSVKITPTIKVIPTNTPATLTITHEPFPTSLPVIRYAQPNYQQPASSTNDNKAPSYQNYGWYMHDGVSMQYVNGQWYSTPQQGIPTFPPQQINSNSNGDTTTAQDYINQANQKNAYNACSQQVENTLGQCESTCNSQNQYGHNACVASYTGQNPLISNNTSFYSQCLSEGSSAYNSCLTNCTDNQKSGLQKCSQ